MRRLILALALAACGGTDAQPTPTGTLCADPDPLTFGYTLADTPGCTGTPDQCNFGKTFMDAYCVNCHSSTLVQSKRNGAPLYHDFDSLIGVVEVLGHIDEQAGFGPDAQNTFMPGAGTGGKCPSFVGCSLDEECPEISAEERTTLAVWLACEKGRTH